METAVPESQVATSKPQKKYFVVSADCHVLELPDLWERIANFTWVTPEIKGRGESCIRPAPRPHWAITRIAPTQEDACN